MCLALDRHELFMPGIVLALVGIALRFWAAGHILKNSELTTSGPYALSRNPLYLGSFIFGLGGITAIRVWWLLAVYAVGFMAFYWPTIRREERGLLQRFGDKYRAYRERVPVFLPLRFHLGEARFSVRNVIGNREHLYALVSLLFLLLLEAVEEFRSFLSSQAG